MAKIKTIFDLDNNDKKENLQGANVLNNTYDYKSLISKEYSNGDAGIKAGGSLIIKAKHFINEGTVVGDDIYCTSKTENSGYIESNIINMTNSLENKEQGLVQSFKSIKIGNKNNQENKRAVSYYFFRHGDTDFKYENIKYGPQNFNLNNNGIKQVLDSINNIKNLGITHIVSSTLKRCEHTTKLIAKALSIPKDNIKFIHGLRERNFGNYNSKNKNTIDGELKKVNKSNSESINKVKILGKGGESLKEFENRVNKSLKDLEDNYGKYNPNVLIVSHGLLFNTLLKIIKSDNKFLEHVNLDKAESARFYGFDQGEKIKNLQQKGKSLIFSNNSQTKETDCSLGNKLGNNIGINIVKRQEDSDLNSYINRQKLRYQNMMLKK